jgi:hypothetical protein
LTSSLTATTTAARFSNIEVVLALALLLKQPASTLIPAHFLLFSTAVIDTQAQDAFPYSRLHSRPG